MSDRFRARSSVLLFVMRGQGEVREILLQRRQNTGYADGMWECAASGHVDADEPMTAAVIREAREELGILLQPEDVHFATLIHKYTRETGEIYYCGYFLAEHYEGTPRICEPEKCAELRWFALDALPDALIEDRRMAIDHMRRGIPYGEFGWLPRGRSNKAAGPLEPGHREETDG